MVEQITLEEQEQILEEAYSLILDPKHWTPGKWKCPLYETDGKGRVIAGEDGAVIQAKTANGIPMYQYCIEGAVNQATFNILGEERALAVGAVAYRDDPEGYVDPNGLSFQGNEELATYPTRALGLNAITEDLYGMESAMSFNDDNDGEEIDTHEGVLTILRTGLERVRIRLGRKVA